MKIVKPRTINGTQFKFINKLSLPETLKMVVTLQISDSLWSHLTEGFVMENRAQNKIEYHQIVLSYVLGNEAKRNADKWTGSRKDRDGLLCHEHACKPQPEDKFHNAVPGVSPSSRILRTVAALVLTFWTSPVDYFLLGAWCQNKR